MNIYFLLIRSGLFSEQAPLSVWIHLFEVFRKSCRDKEGIPAEKAGFGGGNLYSWEANLHKSFLHYWNSYICVSGRLCGFFALNENYLFVHVVTFHSRSAWKWDIEFCFHMMENNLIRWGNHVQVCRQKNKRVRSWTFIRPYGKTFLVLPDIYIFVWR